MNDEAGEGFSVTVGDQITWNGEVVTCPECGFDLGHTMTAYRVDTQTAFTCPDDHLWFRDDVPGMFVAAVARKVQEDPRASMIHISQDDMEGKNS